MKGGAAANLHRGGEEVEAHCLRLNQLLDGNVQNMCYFSCLTS